MSRGERYGGSRRINEKGVWREMKGKERNKVREKVEEVIEEETRARRRSGGENGCRESGGEGWKMKRRGGGGGTEGKGMKYYVERG